MSFVCHWALAKQGIGHGAWGTCTALRLRSGTAQLLVEKYWALVISPSSSSSPSSPRVPASPRPPHLTPPLVQ
ncbi:MAG: hypothetical protein RMY29_007420 [Nostoc sp. CreGUA01]|nr:hypothetical protein [Nostoc sp. CreGUA01]